MQGIIRRSSLVFVAAFVATACGGAAAPSPSRTLPASPTANPSAAAVGWTVKNLAQGAVTGLPTAPLYINVLDVPQAPAASTQHAHIAGFVYAAVGVHRVVIQGGPTVDVQPGEGGFIGQDIVHTHTNPGTVPSQWYFIAIRNVGGRIAPPTFPGQSVLYETPDLPALAAGKYNQQMDLITLERGGRTPAHQHGGVETLVVLDGTVQVRVAGQQPATLTKGKGAYVMPNNLMQVTNTGDGTARYLNFFVTLDGATFFTPATAVP
ncbi:MAG: cupin domain-containing protein [Candidatus Limnocylindria bacterium]